jgi:hypothetical protein
MDSATIAAVLPEERKIEHYYLPTRMLGWLEQALQALGDRGDQQPLVEYCCTLQIWFNAAYPPPLGHLIAICQYDRQIAINFWHNQGKISYLTVVSMSQWEVTHTIPIEDAAKFLAQPEAMDELGDQYFGELEWQKLKSWIM